MGRQGISYWVANKDTSRIVPGVTRGEFRWEPEAGEVEGGVSTSRASRGVHRGAPVGRPEIRQERRPTRSEEPGFQCSCCGCFVGNSWGPKGRTHIGRTHTASESDSDRLDGRVGTAGSFCDCCRIWIPVLRLSAAPGPERPDRCPSGSPGTSSGVVT